MATKLKHQKPQSGPDNVVSIVRCVADGCGKRADRMTFCSEHFDWFKFGLITKEGKRPTDFDKKYQAFMSMKKKAA